MFTALEFENKIYASVKCGLVVIAPGAKSRNENDLFFNFLSITVDSKEIDARYFKKLSSNQKSIAFAFDLVTFSDVRPQIKYKLYGSLSDSGLVTNGLVKFDRLAPGNYTLSVFALVKNGEKLKQTILFFVEPAFWQTPWFRIFSSIGILVIILGASWAIISINKKRNAVKTKNDQLLLEYKLVALKAQINPHFMSNCLSAIQHLVKTDKSKATTYIAKFGLLVRQILDFSSRAVVTLEEELELLKVYIDLEQLRFEDKFTYTIAVAEQVLLKENYIPPLILNPLVENAIWHGLLPRKEQKGSTLAVTVKKEDRLLVIVIEDNGVGRSSLLTTKTKKRSYGIQITEQRLINVNYLYKRSGAKMSFTDLKDENGEALGTRVTIYLPEDLKPLKHE